MRAHIQGSETETGKVTDIGLLLPAAVDKGGEKEEKIEEKNAEMSQNDIDPKDLKIRISFNTDGDDDYDNDGFESSEEEDDDDDEDDDEEDDDERDSGGDMEDDGPDIGAKSSSRHLATNLSPRTRRRASKDFDSLFPTKFEGGSKIQLLMQRNKRGERGSAVNNKTVEVNATIADAESSPGSVPNGGDALVVEREGRGLVPGGRVGGAPQQSRKAGNGWSGGPAGARDGGRSDENGECEESRSVGFTASSSSSSSTTKTPAMSKLSTSSEGTASAGAEELSESLGDSGAEITLTSKEITEISGRAFRGVGRIFENYAASYQRIAVAMEEAHKCFEENVLLHIAAANQVSSTPLSLVPCLPLESSIFI